MLVRLLLIMILIVISLFCWLSLLNPMDVEFRFFGETIPTDLSTIRLLSPSFSERAHFPLSIPD
jgi:hypothetical protein